MDRPWFGGRVEVTSSHTERHGQHAMVRDGPVEGVLLDNVGQPRFVGEEHGEVSGEDGLLHHIQSLLVLLGVEAVKDAVGLLLEDADPHGEVVVLHGGGRVDLGQRRLDVNHEFVVVASVVQVMADGSNPLAKTLNI